jgi:hypothetical protein
MASIIFLSVETPTSTWLLTGNVFHISLMHGKAGLIRITSNKVRTYSDNRECLGEYTKVGMVRAK